MHKQFTSSNHGAGQIMIPSAIILQARTFLLALTHCKPFGISKDGRQPSALWKHMQAGLFGEVLLKLSQMHVRLDVLLVLCHPSSGICLFASESMP